MFCRNFLRYSLFIVNLLFSIIGIIIIILGLAVYFMLTNSPGFKLIAYVVIGFGGFVFLVSFFGACGSITEIKWLLITYALIIALLTAIEIYVAVQFNSYKTTVREIVDNALNDAFLNIENDSTFNGIEIVFRCCGTTGPDSYNATFNGTNINDTYIDLIKEGYLPPSCCENPAEINKCVKTDAFPIGCVTLIDEIIQDVFSIFIIVLISIIVYQLMVLLSTTYITFTIKS